MINLLHNVLSKKISDSVFIFYEKVWPTKKEVLALLQNAKKRKAFLKSICLILSLITIM